ncbi:hypothetical protein C7271_04935 [filamentous cyanobacterium CCP5]|nr:hypothetical protein C7271_04935 [filamentous cyanobacterium CCP5]
MLRHPATGRAHFDPTGVYRYSLERLWEKSGQRLAIVMLNPSQADQHRNDPTLRRCVGLSQNWGFTQLEVVNLFAYRTPHPCQLKQAQDPIGGENDRWLLTAAERADQILLAWGNAGGWLDRDHAVLALLKAYRSKFCCLGQNRTGSPRHPLYVPRDSCPTDWLS